MRKFDNGGILVQRDDPLPDLSGEELFLDAETTSFDRKIKSLNPWHNCWLLGICIKSDHGPAYYVPVNHADEQHNRDPVEIQRWLEAVFKRHKRWVNHNVKYDIQVIFNQLKLWAPDYVEIVCTLDLAKLIDSDRFSHGLDTLSAAWLNHDISKYENAMKPWLEDDDNEDYGLVPTHIMAEYGTQDVITEARLWKYIQDNMPPESQRVAADSRRVTSILAEIEQNGMRVDKKQVAVEELHSLNRQVQIIQELQKDIGFLIEPHVPNDCRAYLIDYCGLPVLEWGKETKKGTRNPKFDKNVLKAYKTLPGAPVHNLDLMLEHRKLHNLTSLFCKPYRELEINGLLHPSYKQTVRTGRMACGLPNMQQLSAAAKRMMLCGDDECIISIDYSQIEFRVIVHYINDLACIAAYQDDPFTDFHNWVKDMCAVDRDSAKTINFMMGFGGGRNKVIKSLMQQEHIVGEILKEVEQMGLPEAQAKNLFEQLAKTAGTKVYNNYHGTLPTMKPTSRKAENAVHKFGYITNLYGRRRHLPPQAAWRAFNTVCQGTAADMLKAQLIKLYDHIQVVAPELKLIGCVHDEVVLRGPKELAENDALLDGLCYVMEDIDVPLRVPIRTSLGVSTDHWLEASKGDSERRFDRSNFSLATAT